MGRLAPVPGRLQRLDSDVPGTRPLVVVDYAHTPDALEQVLQSLSGVARAAHGKLVCVFGCGGDRDRGKRPVMGEIATRLADTVVITSDNPRSENPRRIIDDILAGCAGQPLVEVDRRAAIERAIGGAGANDVVLLAGKGHETYQEIGGARIPFSDIEVARELLRGGVSVRDTMLRVGEGRERGRRTPPRGGRGRVQRRQRQPQNRAGRTVCCLARRAFRRARVRRRRGG